MKILYLLAALVAMCSTAFAWSRYDGRWSVSIVTEQGKCDSYRYPVIIKDGRLINPDGGTVLVTGTVRDGVVKVRAEFNGKVASGTGRLSGVIGYGVWHNENCNGRWEAEKREE